MSNYIGNVEACVEGFAEEWVKVLYMAITDIIVRKHVNKARFDWLGFAPDFADDLDMLVKMVEEVEE